MTTYTWHSRTSTGHISWGPIKNVPPPPPPPGVPPPPPPVPFGPLTFTPWVQNSFAPTFYTYANNTDLLLDETTGQVYSIAEQISNDNGIFIYMNVRTANEDGGTNETKFCSALELIGDKVPDTAYIAYSDNDYQSFGWYRQVNLNAARSQLRRCGSFRRRAHSIIYLGPYQERFSSIEMNLNKGTM